MGARALRFGTVVMVMAVCIFLQVYLVIQCKKFVSAKAVHDVREAYHAYEKKMYANCTYTVNGKCRGVGPLLKPNFQTLTADEQSAACRIPLSQPDFFFTILFIWTLTTCRELKQSGYLFHKTVMLPTCKSMAQITKDPDGEEFIVEKLPIPMKAFILVFVIIPRFAIAVFLTWLGCRWLIGTNNFADLILNAVALEFILCLKDMLFASLMTSKNRQDVQTTKFTPHPKKEQAGQALFVTTFVYISCAFLWVVIYTGFVPVLDYRFTGVQQVLPGYKWDVHEMCDKWIAWRYCVSGDCPPAP